MNVGIAGYRCTVLPPVLRTQHQVRGRAKGFIEEVVFDQDSSDK